LGEARPLRAYVNGWIEACEFSFRIRLDGVKRDNLDRLDRASIICAVRGSAQEGIEAYKDLLSQPCMNRLAAVVPPWQIL
jgi:hypothetical protein